MGTLFSTVHISFLTTLCFILTGAQWISPAKWINNRDSNMAIGYYQNTLIMLGGWSNPKDIIEYDMISNSFTVSANALQIETKGSSQFYTQIDDTMYMIDTSGTAINAYDISTKTYTQNINWNIPHDVSDDACIASTSHELYVIGGYIDEPLSNVQILTLSTLSWSDAPSLMEARYWRSCVVSSINNKLYTIGGATAEGYLSDYLSTIEFISVINPHDHSWQYTTNDLTEALVSTRAVIYDPFIYVIGGQNCNGEYVTKVHVIDTNTNTVYTSSDELVYGGTSMAAIIVDHTLYAFGGWDDDGYTDQWQYYDLLTSEFTTTTVTPSTDSPSTDAPTTDAPTTDTPTTDTPTTDAPTTDAPTTDVPTTDAPTTADPTTDVPTTDTPTTDAPTTYVPTTDATTTADAPTTDGPTTNVAITINTTANTRTTQTQSHAMIIAKLNVQTTTVHPYKTTSVSSYRSTTTKTNMFAIIMISLCAALCCIVCCVLMAMWRYMQMPRYPVKQVNNVNVANGVNGTVTAVGDTADLGCNQENIEAELSTTLTDNVMLCVSGMDTEGDLDNNHNVENETFGFEIQRHVDAHAYPAEPNTEDDDILDDIEYPEDVMTAGGHVSNERHERGEEMNAFDEGCVKTDDVMRLVSKASSGSMNIVMDVFSDKTPF